MAERSDHLLRTLATVAPGARVVDAACGDGRHLDALARLGFDVWAVTDGDPAPARRVLAESLGEEEAARRVTAADPDALGYPDAWADWAVLSDPDPAHLADALAEVRRVLRPGAWVWVEGPDAETLTMAADAAYLAPSEEPQPEGDRWHAVFRRPGGVR